MQSTPQNDQSNQLPNGPPLDNQLTPGTSAQFNVLSDNILENISQPTIFTGSNSQSIITPQKVNIGKQIVTLEEVRPHAKAQKRKSNGKTTKKKGKSLLLTDTPVKNEVGALKRERERKKAKPGKNLKERLASGLFKKSLN